MIGLWWNGSTTGFGSVCPGSNPGSPTIRPQKISFGAFFLSNSINIPLKKKRKYVLNKTPKSFTLNASAFEFKRKYVLN